MFLFHSEVKLRVKELKDQKAAIERKCQVLWEMAFCVHQSEERRNREGRGDLRRTRSQNDMVHTLTLPTPGKSSQGQGLAGMRGNMGNKYPISKRG